LFFNFCLWALCAALNPLTTYQRSGVTSRANSRFVHVTWLELRRRTQPES
jgi:hypothetical protein